jgi:hypothetical protein
MVAHFIFVAAMLLCLGQQEHPDHSGLGVDRSGNPVVDPTKNVLDLTNAATKRIDDLRATDSKYIELAIKRLDDLRAIESLRIDQLRQAESLRIKEQLEIRADYSQRLELAEAKRIDAIRAVDVSAVAVASQRASDQALVLAAQVATSAEALRALVATTAATVAQSQQQLSATLTTRLTSLEQAQYEGKGKQTYTDPQLIELVAEMKALRALQSNTTGKSEGSSALWGYLVGGVGLLIAAAAAYARTPTGTKKGP